jgi:hypothetical protein
MERFRKLYEYMKESNELHRVYYDLVGDWEQDQYKFTKAQLEIEKSAGIIDLEDEI